jgi:dihydroorotate dehydrogenase (NAD+) catalytic subunit
MIDIDTTVRLGPLELSNPIVAASGTFGQGDELARLCDPARLGAVTAKSQAPFEWAGNPPPRLHPATAGMVNAVGLQGHGVTHWVAHDLPSLHDRGARVIASLWGHTIDDYRAGAEQLRPAVAALAALELNLSCPNTDAGGQMFATNAGDTKAVVAAVAAVGLGVPLLAKLTATTAVADIAGAAAGAGADAVTVINTVRALLVDPEARRPVLGSAGGGLSGPAIKPIALLKVHQVHRVARAHGIPIIGQGGIVSAADALEFIIAGASAVGIGTALFYDPLLLPKVNAGIADYLARHGLGRVAELVGTLQVHA